MASDDIPAGEVARLRGLKGPGRLLTTIDTVASTGVLWVWGDDEDTLFTEDADGITVLPVWPWAALAEAEAAGDDPAEHPIEVKLDRFLDVWLPQLEEDGDAIAVFPSEGRIAVTLTPDEFRSKIAAAMRK
jgi:hypothetical protein